MTALDALNLAAPLADTYEAVERRLLVAIARQLSLNDNHTLNEVSKWQIKQLARHGMLSKNAAKIIAAGTNGIPGDVAAAVEQAIGAALAEDGLTEMWQNEGFAESAKQAVKHYRNQAKDVYNQVNTVMKYKAESTFVNAVNSVADKWTAEMRRKQAEIADKQDFLDILNSNTAAVVSGSTARTKAVRDTIHEMAQKGIPAFVDRAGREWSPEAYVNMDIRATVKNTALEAKFSIMDSLGQDVFEVSSHPGSRPKCRPWQGKLISRSGRTTEITDLHGKKHKVIPLSQTSYGEPDGLFGINCGHRPRGCTDGVFTKSEVEYDDEEDKELYNKVCRQRELERRVRKSKTEADMLEAAGDSEGAKAVRRKMAEQNKQLKAYCEDNGLKYRSDRVRTYGSVKPDTDKERRNTIIQEMKKDNEALKGLTKGANGSIIKIEKQRGIEPDMNIDSSAVQNDKHTAAGNRRSPFYELTDKDIETVKAEIKAIGASAEDFVFNSNCTRGTCFLTSDGKIHIKGNIFPDENSAHPRDRLSVRAVLAHEYYGHRPYREQYLREDSDTSPNAISMIMSRAWADEFRASYMAARNAPNLSQEDRAMLILDALSRAEEAGVSIKYNDFIRRVLYG